MKALLVAGFSLVAAALAGPASAAKHSSRHHVSHSVSRAVHARSHRVAASAHHERAITHHMTPNHDHVAVNHGYRHPIDSSYRTDRVAYRSYRHHGHYGAASYRYSALQCVPYAREVSHIELTGNAYLWWAEAADRYGRGDTPEVGAVLNFRGVGRMPLGHVAVVTDVIDSRAVLVTQANWVPGTITNDVRIDDVSPDNNWTQVRVELGDSSTLGSTYPTYGFIYNRPADGTVIAANGQGNEVAEAPAAHTLSTQAPDRNLQ
ncbi:MAG TPA: CHAP domain-containing protein [Acidocella sp.]|uniref:CHAP domain-containing protein n=1 Tax=Acidocella sp. TaxID=50710 RepID=UPI002BFE65E5|nr:CHAP domain-containing protein [Acidocella sp.]HVE22941.1 CHAP domain-containing protein [Acidocella sp.]